MFSAMFRFLLLMLISLPLWSAPGFHLFYSGFKTSVLPHPRDVYVYLPLGYGKINESYPVLYMHDGQNLFNPARAYMGKTWRMEETLNSLIVHKKIPPMIVVGIDNTPDRLNEYTPHFSSEWGKGGKGAQYLKLIVEHLHPLIQKKFRIKSGAENTAVMGSSLGGLISLYAGAKYPHVFGLIGAISPSVWWNDKSIMETLGRSPLPQKVYIDSGTGRGESPEDAIRLSELFAGLGMQHQRNLFLYVQENAEHNEIFWSQRLPVALEFLFNDR